MRAGALSTITLLAASRARLAATCCCCQRRASACKMPDFPSEEHAVAARRSHPRRPRSPSAPPDRQGKVRDIYDFGDRLLIVATDRISAFDYVLGSGIPDKGKVLTQISAFWFERTRAIVAEPPASRPIPPTIPAEARGGRRAAAPAARCSSDGPSRCRSSAWRAATCRARAGRTTTPPATVCGIRCRRACASPTGCRRRSSRRPPRRRAATTSTSARPRRPSSSGRRVLARARDLTLAAVRGGRRARRVVRHHRRRHEVRVRPAARRRRRRRPRRADPDRRGADARLVAVLAARRLPPGRPAAELRQAVRARLPRAHPAGTSSRPVPSLPDDVVAKTREKYLEAFRRLTGRELLSA